MKAAAILLAAGRGERMGTEEPKAFLRLAGKTLLERAVETVESCPDVDAFLVAAPSGQEDRAGDFARSPKLLAVVAGGQTRQDSVRLALASLTEEFDAVLCHDVARPLARPKLFSDVLLPLRNDWGGHGVVPLVPLVDSVKRLHPRDRVESIPRDALHAAQTPQAFWRTSLAAAHRRAAQEGREATDDAELLEWMARPVDAVPGDPANIKITRPEDLVLAEALLRNG
jgi:2-C-methyl-D-erythritol 4-phosphate cytidylyltransferase